MKIQEKRELIEKIHNIIRGLGINYTSTPTLINPTSFNERIGINEKNHRIGTIIVDLNYEHITDITVPNKDNIEEFKREFLAKEILSNKKILSTPQFVVKLEGDFEFKRTGVVYDVNFEPHNKIEFQLPSELLVDNMGSIDENKIEIIAEKLKQDFKKYIHEKK